MSRRPLICASTGTVICCSTSSAARPGHCVITCTQLLATSGYASTGSLMKAMMPHTRITTPSAITSRRSRSAKSRIQRIMRGVRPLPFDCGCELQSVLDGFVALVQTREDILQTVRRYFAAVNLHTTELLAAERPEHPILVVKTQDRGGRNHHAVA